jgi:leader peptidase (prepilin peptidase)/N-methyltransferase
LTAPSSEWLAAAFAFYGFAFVVGVIIGSFLNVVIWRLPRGGSIASPTWSYCPQCEHRLGALDLVPVLSFLFLGRKCRYCRAPISWRYPGIELLTGIAFLSIALRFGFVIDTPFYCAFAAALICVVMIDLEHFIIPDGLNVFIALVGFARNGARIWADRGDMSQWSRIGTHLVPASVAGFVVYAFVMYTVALLAYIYLVSFKDRRKDPFRAGADYIGENALDWVLIGVGYLSIVIPPLRKFTAEPEPLTGTTAEEIAEDEDAGGVGGGDGKLAAAIGANLYWPLALQSFFFAIVAGAIAGAIVLIKQKRKLGSLVPIPFGPAMAFGAVIALFSEGKLWEWYVKMLLPPQ